MPTDFTFAGDFQILKSINNMSLYTSPIWCTCEKLTLWPSEPLKDWSAVLAYFDKPGHGAKPCVVKSLRRMCELAGYSYEVLVGEPFKPFNCGQKCKNLHSWTTEASWRAFVKKTVDLEEPEYKTLAAEWGRDHYRHYPGYAPSLYDKEKGMHLFSVDILHLIFINLAKMHLESMLLVFLEELSAEAREPAEAFLHSKGIPIRLAKAQNVTEMSNSLTGRDMKVLCEKATEILPELLEWAHAPQEAVEAAARDTAREVASGQRAPGGRSLDVDNTFSMGRAGGESDESDEEDEERAEELEARKMQYAGYFEDFLMVVHAVRPFERDDKEYREERATELFNAGSKVGRNMVAVRSDFQSSVPHVLTHIVTRQMVMYGDPQRRACDQSEAIGVNIKFDLHNRCNRQRVKEKESKC